MDTFRQIYPNEADLQNFLTAVKAMLNPETSPITLVLTGPGNTLKTTLAKYISKLSPKIKCRHPESPINRDDFWQNLDGYHVVIVTDFEHPGDYMVHHTVSFQNLPQFDWLAAFKEVFNLPDLDSTDYNLFNVRVTNYVSEHLKNLNRKDLKNLCQETYGHSDLNQLTNLQAYSLYLNL